MTKLISPSAAPPDADIRAPVWSIVPTEQGGRLVLEGTWTVPEGGVPTFDAQALKNLKSGQNLLVDAKGVNEWDSALISFLWDVEQATTTAGLTFDVSILPDPTQRLLALLPPTPPAATPSQFVKQNLFARIGQATLNALEETGVLTEMMAQSIVGALRAITSKSFMRGKDLLNDIWRAGPNALLIVGVVNFLLGAILAFVGLVELRRFAAEIYVTDLVGIACAREISAIMTAIIMAGRTGGAYAARISTMLGNEEIDALQVFGIPISSYILLPSIISLSIMMPLLYLYGTLIGIFGGFVVSMSMMDVSPTGYWISTFNGVELKEFVFGFIKSFFFACFIALAACRVGLKAGRSAADVGVAATRAVVIGIVGIIAMDAVFAVLANALGI
jgi:phospholipid/cholesterol/gamma-HCH transport system permease protein